MNERDGIVGASAPMSAGHSADAQAHYDKAEQLSNAAKWPEVVDPPGWLLHPSWRLNPKQVAPPHVVAEYMREMATYAMLSPLSRRRCDEAAECIEELVYLLSKSEDLRLKPNPPE